MPHPGSRTRTTDLWLLPEDEALLGQRIGNALPTGWLCSQPGPVGLHRVHLHATVAEAFDCGGVQVFLPLPAGAAAPDGVEVAGGVVTDPGLRGAAIVQLLRSHVRGGVFGCGRLAVRWSEPDVGPELHRLLGEQVAEVWRALRAATRPAALRDATGRELSGTRIGAAARELVVRTGIPLSRNGGPHRHLAR
ncbi:hypothetical protein AB0I60_33340 [Actinosynnema sp. NPDC050436]|uniref:hypothetical protein n=1 Tax=Actinosynnema sp. NPDC050436 TaxID=3155659 RepID=UPI0033D80B68